MGTELKLNGSPKPYSTPGLAKHVVALWSTKVAAEKCGVPQLGVYPVIKVNSQQLLFGCLASQTNMFSSF